MRGGRGSARERERERESRNVKKTELNSLFFSDTYKKKKQMPAVVAAPSSGAAADAQQEMPPPQLQQQQPAEEDESPSTSSSSSEDEDDFRGGENRKRRKKARANESKPRPPPALRWMRTPLNVVEHGGGAGTSASTPHLASVPLQRVLGLDPRLEAHLRENLGFHSLLPVQAAVWAAAAGGRTRKLSFPVSSARRPRAARGRPHVLPRQYGPGCAAPKPLPQPRLHV